MHVITMNQQLQGSETSPELLDKLFALLVSKPLGENTIQFVVIPVVTLFEVFVAVAFRQPIEKPTDRRRGDRSLNVSAFSDSGGGLIC